MEHNVFMASHVVVSGGFVGVNVTLRDHVAIVLSSGGEEPSVPPFRARVCAASEGFPR
jgi:hypothetical protein